jgi:alkyl hydroperoxide reductase subunit AhpF
MTVPAQRLLDDGVIGQIKEAFQQLKEPVQLLYFGSQQGCEYCETTLQLLRELAAAEDRLGLSIHDLDADRALALQYGVDKAPGIVIAAREGSQNRPLGMQFSGMPSGYEFGTLINAIMLASGRELGLSERTRQVLLALKKPLLLQVFVTPT